VTSKDRHTAQVHSAARLTREAVSASPVLSALLANSNLEREFAMALIKRGAATDTLIVDYAYLEFAAEAASKDPHILAELDLPHRALVAKAPGWPEAWDATDLKTSKIDLIDGVWELLPAQAEAAARTRAIGWRRTAHRPRPGRRHRC
jgi:hypothetical protein